ncbi:MAG: 16S rRNA (guanine(527)-N(7))-methyltransferase RsmG [Acidobacteriaceae bacterium]
MLSEARIAELLQPYLPKAPPALCASLSTYLDLLLRWNARTNLTAIRDPEEIVRRHFGESLFAGIYLHPLLPPNAMLLDFGSGAGFPGLPIQLLLPDLTVTLAESQGKKASFLREVVRALDLKTEVWLGRVEDMPSDRRFNAVTLRAVDNMDVALAEAARRLHPSGVLASLTAAASPNPSPTSQRVPLPLTATSFLHLHRI